MAGLKDQEAGKPSSKMHFWAFSADLVQDYSVSAGDWQNISGGLGKDQAMGSPLGSMHCSFIPSEEEEGMKHMSLLPAGPQLRACGMDLPSICSVHCAAPWGADGSCVISR